MPKLDLALVVRTVDQATRPIRNIQRAVRQVGRSTGLHRVGRNLRMTGRQFAQVGREAGHFVKRIGSIGAVVAGAIGGFALTASAKMEQLQVALESMLGSADAAQDMVDDLSQFAARTPFQLQGIGASAKQLLAFGVDAADIIPTLQMLGDIAAGAGVPLADMAQIYGKSMAKGKAQTEELNQMAERGVPILDALVKLAEKYGNTISKEQVYKAAEKGNISAKTIGEALALLTAEGGVFNQQMVKQSETLTGLASTVKDNLFNTFAVLGDKISETFKVKDSMKELITFLGDLGEGLKLPFDEQTGLARELTKAFDDIKAVVGALTGAWNWLSDAVAGLIDWVRETFPWFDELVGKAKKTGEEVSILTWMVGGLGLVLGVKLIKAIGATVIPLAKLGASVIITGLRMLWFSAYGVFVASKALFGFAKKAIPAAIAGLKTLGEGGARQSLDPDRRLDRRGGVADLQVLGRDRRVLRRDMEADHRLRRYGGMDIGTQELGAGASGDHSQLVVRDGRVLRTDMVQADRLRRRERVDCRAGGVRPDRRGRRLDQQPLGWREERLV